jgi:ribosomal protein S27AE
VCYTAYGIDKRNEEHDRMVERICPQCGHGNPLDHHFCGKCGAALERLLAGAAVAATAGAPERGTPGTLARRWAGGGDQRGGAGGRSWHCLAGTAGSNSARRRWFPLYRLRGSFLRMHRCQRRGEATNIVTIISERVIELIDDGNGTRRISERTFWRRIEE